MFQQLAKQATEKMIAENEDARVANERRQAKKNVEEAIEMLEDFREGLSIMAKVDEVTGIVEIDGVRFEGRYMLGNCPACGEEVQSNYVRSLERIGALLTSFEPCSDHYWECPKRKEAEAANTEAQTDSAAKRLFAAWQEFCNTYGDSPF